MASGPIVVRRAQVEDVESMADVVVRSWQETYRGLMPDDVLDDPGAVRPGCSSGTPR